MTPVRVRLVRHGRAAAGWDVDPDPGLDELGRSQAEAVAAALTSAIGDAGGEVDGVRIVSSPMRRCRETAEFFARSMDAAVSISDRVTEIPSPDGYEMSDRVDWLRAAMAGEWSALGDRYEAYRSGVVDAVASFEQDSVVFSHFVAINAVIGACLGDDRLVIRRLDNCSVTTVEVSDSGLTLLEAGSEADTLIR